MGTTTKYQLPYPELADPADAQAAVKPLADRIEVVLPTLPVAAAAREFPVNDGAAWRSSGAYKASVSGLDAAGRTDGWLISASGGAAVWAPPPLVPRAYADVRANRPPIGSVVEGSIFWATDTHDVFVAQGGVWIAASGQMRASAFAQPIVGVSNKQTYGDPNTGTAGSTGPTLTGLVDGAWYVNFGAICSQDASGAPGHSPMYMALAINGVMPANDNEATWHRNGYESNVVHSQLVQLAAGGTSNVLKCVYRGGDNSNGHWINRWLTAVRTGP